MPIQRYPNSAQNWQINYGPDSYADIKGTFQVSLTMNPGKITTSRRLQPHTTTAGSVLDNVPSQYVFTNADGTQQFWKYWFDLWKTPDQQVSFVQDTLLNSPEDNDGDLAVFGRTADGLFDILYATEGGTNLAVLNRDFSTTSWTSQYWTGLTNPIISSANDGTGNVRITATAHGYGLGDIVVITGHSEATVNGTWIIDGVSGNFFDLAGSVYVADGTGGTVVRTFDATTGVTSLGQPQLEGAYPTILKRFSSNSQDLLFVGNGNVVHSIDLQGNVVNRRMVFFADYEVNWIQVSKDRVYIGFKNKNNPERASYVVEYDPFMEADNPLIVTSGETIGFVDENICHIVDVKGWISRFNANGFTHIVAFPFAYVDGVRMTAPHRNGISFIDGRPHILMPGRNKFMVQVCPGGVWCWETDTNKLYHKGAPAQSSAVQDDYGAPTIGGVFVGRYGALFGIPSQIKTQDYFAGLTTKVTTNNNTGISGTFSTVVVGFPVAAVSMNNRGWVVTSKIYSRDTNAIWRNVVTQYDNNQYPFGRQSGALLIKYRTSDPIDQSASFDTGTWTSTTTFTAVIADVPNMVVGDEIWVLSGKGAGLSAHITAIAGTSVTIDEVVTGATGEFIFIYENWRKLIDETHLTGQITDNTADGWQFDIPENEQTWIQFKVEIRSAGTTPFRGFALEELGLGYQENLIQEFGQRDRS